MISPLYPDGVESGNGQRNLLGLPEKLKKYQFHDVLLECLSSWQEKIGQPHLERVMAVDLFHFPQPQLKKASVERN